MGHAKCVPCLGSTPWTLAVSVAASPTGVIAPPAEANVLVDDRALAAAERSGDPIAIGAASRRVAKSLTYQDRPAAAVAVASSALARSTAAVRQATGHVDQAEEVVKQQGADLNEDWIVFGPTTELSGLTHERRAQHLITMARAQLFEAEWLAPEEVYGRQTTVDLVADIVGAMPVPSAELRGLAERCGVLA